MITFSGFLGSWRVGVVGVVGAGLLLAGCSGEVSRSAGSDVFGGSAVELAALPGVGSGAGEQVSPVFSRSVLSVSDDQLIATSLRPTLSAVAKARKRGSQVKGGVWEFWLANLASLEDTKWGNPLPSAGAGTVKVGQDRLVDGYGYQWKAKGPDGKGYGPSIFTVDTGRVSSQGADSFGGVGVDLASGVSHLTLSTHQMNSASGGVGLGLDFQPGNDPWPGMPVNWRLVAPSAVSWDQLVVASGGSVVNLHSKSGSWLTYRHSGNGVFDPVFGRTGELAPTGRFATLVRNDATDDDDDDGGGGGGDTWTVTDIDQTVTTFGGADGDGKSWPTSVSMSGVLGLEQTYGEQGRLASLRDPVSGREVSLHYGGGDCGDVGQGFVDAPDGLLCRVEFWDGSQSWIGYVSAADQVGGVQVGRLVDFPDADGGEGTAVTDMAYDQAGRLARVRAPLIAAVQAAGVLGDSAQVDVEPLLTKVSYNKSGQVTGVSAPAPSLGDGVEGLSRTYEYGNDNVTKIMSEKVGGGPLSTVTYDPNTFNVLTSKDHAGLKAEFDWDEVTGDLLEQTSPSGAVTKYEYDDARQLKAQLGPTTGDVEGAGSPKTTYKYDQVYAKHDDLKGKSYRGLSFQVWDNTSWQGTPSAAELGPTFDKDGQAELYSKFAVNWDSPPGGVDGDWSGRFSGNLMIDEPTSTKKSKKGSGDPQEYSLEVSHGTLWVDNIKCEGDACKKVPLTAGAHSVRIDLSVSNVEPGAAGSLTFKYGKSDSQLEVASISSLTPGYNLPTQTMVKDQLGNAGTTDARQRTAYADPETSLATKLWNTSGDTTTTAYEPFAQEARQYGRPTQVYLPMNNATQFTYWGEESSDPGCEGFDAQHQIGLPQAVIDPNPDNGEASGVASTNWYNAAGAVFAVKFGDTAVSCSTFDDAGRVVTNSQAGPDGQGTDTQIDYAVSGNPLTASWTSTVAGSEPKTVSVETDLLGRTVKRADQWGSTAEYTYDETTGKQTQEVVTVNPGTPDAYVVTNKSTYFEDTGALHTSITTDNRGLGSQDFGDDADPNLTPLKVSLQYNSSTGLLKQAFYAGNKTQANFGYDNSQRPTEVVWKDGDGKTWTSTMGFASSGRIMTAGFDTPQQASSDYDYTYDESARLAKATLASDLTNAKKAKKAKQGEPLPTSWAYEYDDNSNRTEQTVKNSSGDTKITYNYDQADRLTEVNGDPLIDGDGAIQYNNNGSMTQIGPLEIDYNQANQTTQITDTHNNTIINYQRDSNNNVVAKTTTTPDGNTTTIRYTLGGILLDENNQPYLQQIQASGAFIQRAIPPTTEPETTEPETTEPETTTPATPEAETTQPETTPDTTPETETGEPATPDDNTEPTTEPNEQPNQVDRQAGTEEEQPQTQPETTPTSETTWNYQALNGNTFWTSGADGKPNTKTPTLYDPFGQQLTNTQTTPNPTTPTQNYQARNNLETENLTLPTILMGERLYIPTLGRFTTTDPIQGGSANNYDYANQDPINNDDPSGQSWKGWMHAIVGIALTVVAFTAGGVFGAAAGSAVGAFFVGAAVGAVVGFAGYAITHMGPHQGWSWSSAIIHTLGAALVGGTAGKGRFAARKAAKVGAAATANGLQADAIATDLENEAAVGFSNAGEFEGISESNSMGSRISESRSDSFFSFDSRSSRGEGFESFAEQNVHSSGAVDGLNIDKWGVWQDSKNLHLF